MRRKEPQWSLRALTGTIGDCLGLVGKYVGYFNSVARLAQLLPLVIGFFVVFFSPSAWLSEVLRKWAFGGMTIGSAVGIVSLAWLTMKRQGQRDNQAPADGMFGLFLLSAVLLRLHLGLSDPTFVQNLGPVQTLHDFYLSSDLGEFLFNLIAAVCFAVVVFAATVSLPLHLRGWAKRFVKPPEDHQEFGGSHLLTTLGNVSKEVEKLCATIASLQKENETLKAELENRQQLINEFLEEKARNSNVSEVTA